jgi:hypothetical protein
MPPHPKNTNALGCTGVEVNTDSLSPPSDFVQRSLGVDLALVEHFHRPLQMHCLNNMEVHKKD